uniref:Putative secreted protein n=1 Tax=Anopheles darlingi TaxID=43151 RepID=A0A2M4D692_ANODA
MLPFLRCLHLTYCVSLTCGTGVDIFYQIPPFAAGGKEGRRRRLIVLPVDTRRARSDDVDIDASSPSHENNDRAHDEVDE